MEYVSYKQAADHFKISTQSLGKWINTHPEFKEEYVTRKFHTGKVKYVMSKEALLIIANVRDSNRGNQHDVKRAPSIQAANFKKDLVERAIKVEKDKKLPVRIPDNQTIGQLEMMIQSARATIQVLKKAEENEVKIQNNERRLALLEGDINLIPITKSQRDFLNSRVRNLAHHRGQQHSTVWRSLHEQLGKESIKEYSMHTYSLAQKILRHWHEFYNIPL